MAKYDHLKIEKKWQDVWAKTDLYAAKDFDERPKFYCLVEFPYPSGERLHVGHGRSYSALDAMSRLKRMQGYNVMFPIGWDAFGLPAENYAIKTGIHPSITTKKNIENSKKQLISWGCSFDWNREINTTDPSYYKWTQWIFLKLYEMGLAYKVKMPINWCPSCKTGLANEEVIDGKCERCGAESERRELDQWMLRITKYADRLIEDLGGLDYLSKIKTQQINWIGKSEGAEVLFLAKDTAGREHDLWVFTTRPDTLYGATFMVIAPEHPLVDKLTTKKQVKKVQQYILDTTKKSDLERTDLGKDKTGVFTGSYATNPINGEQIPIWISDYVMMNYGQGAIMAVPAHDERDYAFANKFDLPIKCVVAKDFGEPLSDVVDVTGPVVIGYDPRTKKYMSLINKNNNMRWLVSGGLEKGETYEEAARRELVEESGFPEIEELISLGDPTYSYYYNTNKKSNRRSFSYMYLAIIDASTQVAQQQESHENYKVVWSDFDSILEDFKKEPSGRDHWIEGMNRVLEVTKSYHAGVPYLPVLHSGHGVLIDSSEFCGLNSKEAQEKIIVKLSKKKMAKKAVNYKLRDWIFSRQHYWGEPIPIIHCEKCGEVPVPIKDLPVELPMVEKYEPTGTGESPLASVSDWVNVKCPKCGGSAMRETDTMPNWAGSSWYFIRYVDANNDKMLADPDKMKYWLPVDLYNGGMEHTTLHLLYSRFWYKALFDADIVPTPEPYTRRHSHGMILGNDNQKMSKSRGNVVNPDEIIEKFGGDTFRTYEMFIGPFEEVAAWNEKGIEGVHRFLKKAWNLFELPIETKEPSIHQVRLVDRTIKKVEHDILGFRFNTAVSALMILVNELTKEKVQNKLILEKLTIILAPFAPHMAEELWSHLGNRESVHLQSWPKYDEKMLKDELITIVVQVNGKVRDSLLVSAEVSEKEVVVMAMSSEKVKKYTEGKEIKKQIYIKGKILSIVTD